MARWLLRSCRGGAAWGSCVPRVPLRPPVGGLRSTRGYTPAPRWGENQCLPLCALCPRRVGAVGGGEMPLPCLAQAGGIEMT